MENDIKIIPTVEDIRFTTIEIKIAFLMLVFRNQKITAVSKNSPVSVMYQNRKCETTTYNAGQTTSARDTEGKHRRMSPRLAKRINSFCRVDILYLPPTVN